MTFSTIQTFLMPIAFTFLLMLMLLYWGQTAFFGGLKYNKVTNLIFQFSFLSLTALLLLRWVDSGHFPLSNLYESLLFLSWNFLFLNLIAVYTTPEIKDYVNVQGTVLPMPSFAEEASHGHEHKPDHVQNEVCFARGGQEFKASFACGSPKGQEGASNLTLLQVATSSEAVHTKNVPCSVSKTQVFTTSNLFGLTNEAWQPGQGKRAKRALPLLGFAGNKFGKNWHTQLADKFGLGVILSPMALLTFGFAFLSLPKDMQKATALVPALQSNWLMMHVTVMICSYAALLCGSVLSIAFLILNTFFIRGRVKARAKSEVGSLYPIGQSSTVQGKDLYVQKALDVESFAHLSARLDNYSYRILAFGFPLLTIGILSGAVWANEAWGSYWSWDPKEVWALITWIVFAIYLHTRITKGWRGERSAIVASLGFFVVWFCYLGVNLLGVGLHSYGWFSK